MSCEANTGAIEVDAFCDIQPSLKYLSIGPEGNLLNELHGHQVPEYADSPAALTAFKGLLGSVS